MTFTAEPYVASRVLSHHKEIPMPEKTLNDLFLAQLKDIYLRGEEDLSARSPRW